jgi:predicted nucleotidyltransferase
MQPVSDTIDEMVRRIVAEAQPRRIVLFGSAARGDLRPDSDIDLLVIVPDGVHRRHTAQQLYRVLRGIGVPYDIVVATEGDLDRHGDVPGYVYRRALAEGRDVYAA